MLHRQGMRRSLVPLALRQVALPRAPPRLVGDPVPVLRVQRRGALRDVAAPAALGVDDAAAGAAAAAAVGGAAADADAACDRFGAVRTSSRMLRRLRRRRPCAGLRSRRLRVGDLGVLLGSGVPGAIARLPFWLVEMPRASP